MIAMPSRPSGIKEAKCELLIDKVRFIKGLPRQIEVTIRNDGDANCNIKNCILIKPTSSPNWTEVQVAWTMKVLPPGGVSKTIFSYEWTSGTSYFLKVLTEEELEALTLEEVSEGGHN